MPLAQAIPISKGRVTDIAFNLDVLALLTGILIIWRKCSGIAALCSAPH
jgi:hypothetical protein